MPRNLTHSSCASFYSTTRRVLSKARAFYGTKPGSHCCQALLPQVLLPSTLQKIQKEILQCQQSSSPLPPYLLMSLVTFPAQSSFDQYKKAMALRLRFSALQWYKFSPKTELLVVLTTQSEIKLPLVLLNRNSSQIQSSIHMPQGALL